jgi:hypothetical protein
MEDMVESRGTKEVMDGCYLIVDRSTGVFDFMY